jgi:hypothetical protein
LLLLIVSNAQVAHANGSLVFWNFAIVSISSEMIELHLRERLKKGVGDFAQTPWN